MLENLVYGEIREDQGLVLKVDSPKDTNKIILSDSSVVNQSFANLLAKSKIAENVLEFQFSSSNNLKFAKFLPGVNWIGKHFSVSSMNLNKTRYYSLCLTLDTAIRNKHLLLLENITRLEKGENIIDPLLNENEIYSDHLSFYIKKYTVPKALSNHIHNLELNYQSDLTIRGPMGLGLNLFENKLKGTHLIFAAGTGILPFIDLISFTLRYIVRKISRERLNNNSNVIDRNENFEDIVSNDFRLHIYATFAFKESVIYGEVCRQLENLDRKYDLGIFKYNLRVSSEDRTRYDYNFMKENLSGLSKNLSKIYLIGPISFMDDVKESLLATNYIEKDKIILV